MKKGVDRSFIIKMIVFVAIALFAIWIMDNTYWGEQTVYKPLSGEAATDPFYSVQKLSDLVGAHAEWKHVFAEPPTTDSVMVLTDWHWDVIAQRREKIERWVRAGGRLLIDDSLIVSDDSLKNWTGLEYHNVPVKKDDKGNDIEEPTDSTLFEDGEEKNDCETLKLIDHRPEADPNRATYQLCDFDSYRYITSSKPVKWGLRDEHGLQAVRTEIDKGSVTLINGALFGNRELLEGEHALLFVAATQLRHDDHIYFLMDEDGVPLLKLIWRYGSPVVVFGLLLMLAALWRNGMRFGPMAAAINGARRSLAEQIVGTGHFILRFNGDHSLHVATVRALNDAARRHIAHYDRLDTQQRVEALAKVGNVDIESLSHAIHFQGMRNKGELRHAIAVLEQARRQLLKAADKH